MLTITQHRPGTRASESGASDHLYGSYGSGAGPLIMVAGGVHGNEPSGLKALRRVLDWLERARPSFRGRLVAIAGNLTALGRGVRFIDEDLNRIWALERIARLGEPGWRPGSTEQREQADLLRLLNELDGSAHGEVYFLDLHTSSAHGQPFVCIGDTLRNRSFATQFPVPVILGLEEQIDGAILEYVNNLGHVTVGVEAGKHDDPVSIDHHEAFVLLALVAAGCLQERDLPQASDLRQRLRRAVGDLPAVMEVRYRHPITPADGFLMQPGFSNFQPVTEQLQLATDETGEIRSEEAGRVLLPLYQGLGNDGFFLVRDVRPIWLRVSAWLRRLGVDRVAHWLPGVRRDDDERALLVDHHVARWFTVEVFHLLGFRKRRTAGHQLRFTRRRETL